MEKPRPELEDVFDHELAMKAGFLLIKPDAIKLGLAEAIIAYTTERIEKVGAGKLSGVYILDPILPEQIPDLYPNLHPDNYPRVANYLGETNCVMAVFKGNGQVNMRKLLTEIRGRGMHSWSKDELNGNIGLRDSIRGMLPVPGTITQYSDVIAKLKERGFGQNLNFTETEMKAFCRNLVHTPDDLRENLGVLSLLKGYQLRQNLSPKLISMYREVKQKLSN